MGEIVEGYMIKYVGAFYPQEQDEDDYINKWSVCAEDLNLVLASFRNYKEQDFANNAVKVFTNNYSSRVAICWDVCYAYSQEIGEYEAYTEGAARENLEDAMECVATAINAMGIQDKEQYWKDINWGGFVADEPIAAYDSNQDDNCDIEHKCNALQDAFETVSGDNNWGNHKTLKKMVVLHRMGGASGTAWDDGGGDGEFECNRLPYWTDFGSKYNVNLWGMDPYISSTQNDDVIKADRDYFYDTLVPGYETKNTRFLAMIGKAFKPDSDSWLNEARTWYYYNDIKGYDSSRQLDWEDQFDALFWWAFCTAALDTGSPEVEEGYDECSDVKTYIEDISDDNWCV